MSREAQLLQRVRGWFGDGRIGDPRTWLETHGLVALLPDLYGEEEARRWSRRALSENLLLRHHALGVLGALREAGIPAVVLKGLDLLDRIYRDREAHRRTSDMDILVDQRRLDRALALVESLGYRFGGREGKEVQARWSMHVEYDGPQGTRLEIHHELLMDTGCDVTWEELHRAGLVEEGAGPGGCDRLCLEALMVHLLVHLAKHRFGGDSLRWILDILVLLDRFDRALDEGRLVRVARLLRSRRGAGAAVAAMQRLLPEVDFGPLGALATGNLRERLALRLIDTKRVALLGEAGWTFTGSLLCRLLLTPGPRATLLFLRRKRHLRRSRRSAGDTAPPS